MRAAARKAGLIALILAGVAFTSTTLKAQGKNIEKFIRDELRKKEGVGDDASGIKSDLKS